jgi:hypothetical protein
MEETIEQMLRSRHYKFTGTNGKMCIKMIEGNLEITDTGQSPKVSKKNNMITYGYKVLFLFFFTIVVANSYRG